MKASCSTPLSGNYGIEDASLPASLGPTVTAGWICLKGKVVICLGGGVGRLGLLGHIYPIYVVLYDIGLLPSYYLEV